MFRLELQAPFPKRSQIARSRAVDVVLPLAICGNYKHYQCFMRHRNLLRGRFGYGKGIENETATTFHCIALTRDRGEIAESGARGVSLVSEFPIRRLPRPGAKPSRGRFIASRQL